MTEDQAEYKAYHENNCRCDLCQGFWRQWEKARGCWIVNTRTSRRCDTCETDPDKCIVGYGSCRQNDFMFWRPKPSTPVANTQDLIRDECDSIRELLLEKNRKYGDSAIHPVRIFSKADPLEQINVRIDDKLSRVKSAQDDDTEDPELDLIGYLILKRVAKRSKK